MRQLIISADDFGLTEAVTKGISECMHRGLVTRTSAMMCTNGFKWIQTYAKGLSGSIGLHLQLTDGIPLLAAKEIPSLVGADLRFPAKSKDLGLVTLEDIEKEWEAQIAAFMDLGITPSHLDTHHNVHRFPKVFKVYSALAVKYNLPTRPLSPIMARKLNSLNVLGSDYCLETWHGEQITAESLITHLLRAFERIKNNGTVELMCHPGYIDENLKLRSNYVQAREIELAIFLDPRLKSMLASHQINLNQN